MIAYRFFFCYKKSHFIHLHFNLNTGIKLNNNTQLRFILNNGIFPKSEKRNTVRGDIYRLYLQC